MSPGAALRPAATLLLLRDDPLRILMVRRHAKAFFPSALVFPGGTVDPSDHEDDWLPYLTGHEILDPAQRALRIAACRETWEEAAILASTPPMRSIDPDATSFRNLVAGAGARLDLSGLVPFGHWVTPPRVARRFDTHFFVARAPTDGEGMCDGTEIVATEWIEPSELIARAAAGDRSVLFSTLTNVHRIAESGTVAEALAAAQNRPRFTVMPQREDDADGSWITIPEESGYPVTRVRFHGVQGS